MLGREELTKGIKLRVVNATVIPSLTYGCKPVGSTDNAQATQMRVFKLNKECGS